MSQLIINLINLINTLRDRINNLRKIIINNLRKIIINLYLKIFENDHIIGSNEQLIYRQNE